MNGYTEQDEVIGSGSGKQKKLQTLIPLSFFFKLDLFNEVLDKQSIAY